MPQQAAEAEQVAEAGGGLTIDEVLWSFIKDSQNPEDFERFLKVFPSSKFAAEATEKSRIKVAALAERGLYINGALVSASISAEAPVEASGKAASEEFVFQQAGERAVSETFRVWPSQLPDTQRGMRVLVTDCDLYAADPNDPQRQVPGVTNGLVNIRDALRACAFALAADIDNPRLQFQFGRVLDIAGRYKWAEHFYDLAGKQQYSAALVNLGYLARVGVGREVDYDRALNFYLDAAALGNLRARTNVGTAYIRGQGVPKTPEEGILWYRLAASSGWTNAITALGDSYSKGVGVEKDEVEAAKLYRRGRCWPDRRDEQSRTRLCQGCWRREEPEARPRVAGSCDRHGQPVCAAICGKRFLKGDAEAPRRPQARLEPSRTLGKPGKRICLSRPRQGIPRRRVRAGKPDLRRPISTPQWPSALGRIGRPM